MASGAAGDAMVLGEAVIIAGIGCRKGVSGAQVGDAIAAALARAGLQRDALDLIATPVQKGAEPGIIAAANALSVPLVLVPPAELESAIPRSITHSERVVALTGVPSIAEAAALAAGGPSARLMAARTAVGPVTCALAASELPA
jgi:cobalt-precorrin 5A hydrolase